ncbi:MAG: GNAT family N-acetyltransferase [Kiloniellales bacterium]|nr:GNAT family N-acetyltransferase [Kiloniellales bacterium]
MGAPVVRPPSGMAPARETLDGNTVRLEPVDPRRHAKALFQRSHEPDPEGRLWDYMPYGPFDSEAAFADWLTGCAASADPLFFAVIDKASGLPSGMTSYLRITPEMGVIETGHIWFAPAIQRSRASTEAIFLMARHVFDALGYRRFEWKCNALNAASKRAALRLGFSYEGTFRQHLIVKGRNRDTAWFAMLDGDWPAIRANFERWLDDANFDAQGKQRISLSELNRGLLRPMLDFDGRPRPGSA